MHPVHTGLKVNYRVKGTGTVWFKTGHIYSFKYLNYQNDPQPLIICINAITGVNPTTHKKHNYVQGINFTYIPRNRRKEFVKTWQKLWDQTHGHTILTWRIIQRRFPYLQAAIRRYSLGGSMIQQLKEVPFEDMERVVVSSMIKDFSKRIIRARTTGQSWLTVPLGRSGRSALVVKQRYNKA